jgi:hypothetical protein
MSLNLAAQHKNRDRVKALKVAFITEKLDLTQKEAQEFWPVYNEYEEKRANIKYKELRSIKKEIDEHFDAMTDADAKKLIIRINTAEDDMHKLRLEFSKKILEIIPPKKVILLKMAEDDFKKKMFEEYKRLKRERN